MIKAGLLSICLIWLLLFKTNRSINQSALGHPSYSSQNLSPLNQNKKQSNPSITGKPHTGLTQAWSSLKSILTISEKKCQAKKPNLENGSSKCVDYFWWLLENSRFKAIPRLNGSLEHWSNHHVDSWAVNGPRTRRHGLLARYRVDQFKAILI